MVNLCDNIFMRNVSMHLPTAHYSEVMFFALLELRIAEIFLPYSRFMFLDFIVRGSNCLLQNIERVGRKSKS